MLLREQTRHRAESCGLRPPTSCVFISINSSACSCNRIHVIHIVILPQAKSETRNGSDTDPYKPGVYRASEHGDQFLHKEHETQVKGDWFPVPPPPLSKHGSVQCQAAWGASSLNGYRLKRKLGDAGTASFSFLDHLSGVKHTREGAANIREQAVPTGDNLATAQTLPSNSSCSSGLTRGLERAS